MSSTVYPKIPSPGYQQGPVATDPEILYSYARFTQKGITIAGGVGVLPAGTVMARRDSDKLYVAYSPTAAGGPGTDTARGVLRRAVDTGAAGATETQQGNLVISGILKNNMVSVVGYTPGTPGGQEAGMLTDLGAIVDTVRGTFKL